MNQYLTITELNTRIAGLISQDGSLRDIWLRGEISGFKLYRQSGHMYFTLKDDNATLACVMFKSSAAGLAFEPEDGMDVLVRGSVNIYAIQGRYQLYAREMQPAGLGAIHLAIEKLKRRLAAGGYFNEERKRPIPSRAYRIGIVSSRDSAAVQDILKVLKQRCPFVEVALAHSSVQGADAPSELAAGLKLVNEYGLLDAVIIGRGGGSIEDLMAFNSEEVVKAVYESRIPVISAVGHETDVTLADLAADMRAATPTHAAQLAVPDYLAFKVDLQRSRRRLAEAVNRQMQNRQETLDRLMMRRIWQEPAMVFELQEDLLARCRERLQRGISDQLQRHRHDLAVQMAALDRLSPLKTLNRGYSLIEDADKRLVHSVQQVHPGDALKLWLHDGRISATVENIIPKEMKY